MNRWFIAVAAMVAAMVAGCTSEKHADAAAQAEGHDVLADSIREVIKGKPGQFGVAVIIDSKDTITVNNTDDYPLMSMFKLHEALGVSHVLDSLGRDLDSQMVIDRAQLDEHTYSPMLKHYDSQQIEISVGRLIDYILVDSDNNASNLLFDSISSVAVVDSFVKSLVPEDRFQLLWREADMKAVHNRAYDNRSTPLAYASLVNCVFTDSLVSPAKQEHIKSAMIRCDTGLSRLSAPLKDKTGVTFGHRTGSGYVNERGEVVAVNDGGYVTLPSGESYTIVVLVKDYAGPQEDAEAVMADISRVVYDYVNR